MNSVIEIGAFEAKTHLPALLRKVGSGTVYHITHRGKPLAELRPIPPTSSRPVFGEDRGRLVIGNNFDDPIPGAEIYTP
jgi:antitoxin (DNA-binding transcriptional repressor) of toxin-antitoxin stability system